MRTNIVIDDELMATAMRLTGARTKRECVELGLRQLVDRHAIMANQRKILALRGKLTSWEGNIREDRKDR
jgi:Arc/MetJ family transcription regulator